MINGGIGPTLVYRNSSFPSLNICSFFVMDLDDRYARLGEVNYSLSDLCCPPISKRDAAFEMFVTIRCLSKVEQAGGLPSILHLYSPASLSYFRISPTNDFYSLALANPVLNDLLLFRHCLWVLICN